MPTLTPPDSSVDAYIAAIDDSARREDCRRLVAMMQQATGERPKMFGSMVGFGDVHYKYASGHEGDTFVLGFAARKAALSLYLTCDIAQYADLLARLGKHKTGKGCLYINRLSDVDPAVLEALLAKTAAAAGQATK